MKPTIIVDGRMVEVELSEGLFHPSGEFSGNLDFSLKFSEPVPTEKALKNLRVKIPGKDRLIDVAGYQEIPGGLKVTMYSELVPPGKDVPASKVPGRAEVFWLEKSKDEPVQHLIVKAVP